MKTTCFTLPELQKQYELLLLQNAELAHTIKWLQEQLEWFKKKLFGQSSERFVNDDRQPYLPGFEEAFIETQVEQECPITIPAHSRKKTKAQSINTISYPDTLPVERQVLDLPEEEKIDADTGNPLVCIGEDVSRKLAKKPASYFIKEIVRKKYAVAGASEKGILVPSLPDSLILRSPVDESIVADVITKKFCDHLPLYRQEEILRRECISISRQTLSSYVLQAGRALKPLHKALKEEIKASKNIFVDETTVDVLAPGTGKTRTGYMTVMAGGESLNPELRVYEFFTSRKHGEFEELFEGYEGVFHSDKYGAYEKIARGKNRTWAPCFAHIRRKYVEAENGDPKFREAVLLEIQALFEIEDRGKNLSAEERVSLREKEAVPIIESLILRNKNRLAKGVLPKSKMAGAIGYFISLIPHLKNYIQHPYARLDNNVAERALKLVVIGRKNWLFVGREEGGEAAATLYSLTQTCRALGINPHEYFDDVLRRIQGWPIQRVGELLPHRWKRA